MSSRYGVLATRALNQYRRRDVVAYLGLRYYLENTAARTDFWATDVAVDLAIRQSRASYLSVQHFKEIDHAGIITHRAIHLPGPNESLAEAALVDGCANAGHRFAPSASVFSYRPATGQDATGIFAHYIHGLKSRHSKITEICNAQPDARVVFVDIKRFYPTVSMQRAEQGWGRACDESGLSKKLTELGFRLLSNHQQESGQSGGHLLTGPMFSHLIGNLVLSNMDRLLSSGPAKYLRYVDDLTLIGTPRQIKESLHIAQRCLADLDLELHSESSEKTQNISAKDWLLGQHDFVEDHRNTSWMTLIGDLKRMLVLHPEKSESLSSALEDQGFRLPVPDYSAAAAERNYQLRLKKLLSYSWFGRVSRPLTVQGILEQAGTLRREYRSDLDMLLKMSDQGGHSEKRALPKLRYRLGRLIYLADPDLLGSVSSRTKSVAGLEMQSTIAKCVATGELSDVIRFGTNAAQAAAQAMHLSGHERSLSANPISKTEWDSLAMFGLNGLALDSNLMDPERNSLFRFASRGVDAELMRTKDGFMQELSCLHGLFAKPRHADILATAFDTDETIAFDAIEQSHHSFSY